MVAPEGASGASGASVFVANSLTNGAGGVSQYDIGAGSALSPKATPTVAAGNAPVGVAVSRDGKSVYATNNGTNGAGGVSQYDVGPGGSLSPKTTPTVAAGNGPFGVAFSPDGKSVYVTNLSTTGAGGVSQYDVGAGGSLSPKTTPTVAAGNGPVGVAVSPDGKSVYVTNLNTNGAGGVSQYDVGADGSLSPKTTPTVAAGNGPFGVAFSPDGKSVYVANRLTNGVGGVSQYDVGADGSLSPKTTPGVAAGNNPVGVAVSPDGKSVYVANQNTNGVGGVSQYDVGAGGALSPKTTATVAAGPNPFGIAVTPDSVYVTNTTTNGAGGVSQYDVGAGGALSPKATPTVAAGNHPAGIAVLAAPPTASITTPSDGQTVALGQVVGSSFSCSEGASGPGIASCLDQDGHASGATIDTSSTGQHTFAVTATSSDGQSTTTTFHYTVAGPPSASITTPASGASYNLGQAVNASYSCAEGPGGPGIQSCSGPVANGAAIDTSTVGQHAFAVTATSKDGQSATTTFHYTVAGPPTASIATPASGAIYDLGQAVNASYSCAEGPSGPGLQSCTGPVANRARLDTSTPGSHSFAVSATSLDGQVTSQTVSYTVRLPANHLVARPRLKPHADGVFVVTVKVPGPGTVNILIAAWKNNLAHTTRLLQPAPGRFVFARAHKTASGPGTLRILVKPNARGRELVAHHTYRVTLRLWVSYTPTGGRQRDIGYYGLHLP